MFRCSKLWLPFKPCSRLALSKPSSQSGSTLFSRSLISCCASAYSSKFFFFFLFYFIFFIFEFSLTSIYYIYTRISIFLFNFQKKSLKAMLLLRAHVSVIIIIEQADDSVSAVCARKIRSIIILAIY